MIDHRERVFRNHAIDTMEALRADHAAGSRSCRRRTSSW